MACYLLFEGHRFDALGLDNRRADDLWNGGQPFGDPQLADLRLGGLPLGELRLGGLQLADPRL